MDHRHGSFLPAARVSSLGARILIYILYALSLDLIVGYAGIITLGHSAYFGLGAYVAGSSPPRRESAIRCCSLPPRGRGALLGSAPAPSFSGPEL